MEEMEKEYQRGDLVDSINKKLEMKLPPGETIARGDAMEEMVKSDGWKYLRDWINRKIEIDTDLICSLRSGEKETMDNKIDRFLCKDILRKPMEFIEQRNEIQK